MDILAHGLWSTVAVKTFNRKMNGGKIRLWSGIFFGVFPDLFAFTIPTIWAIFGYITGMLDESVFSGPHSSGSMALNNSWVFKIAGNLYDYSHSILIFLFVIALIVLMRFVSEKNHVVSLNALVPWTMFPWLLHILVDIPTHSAEFYPTPFLWPLSGFRFDGIPWGVPWFMILNYSAITLAFVILYLSRKKLIKKK